jgi:HEAT repeat protein
MSSPDAADPKPVEAKRPYDASLPPVEAPTGAFIMQLFLIPLGIVSIVVLLWLSFSWLAQAGRDDPKQLIQDLRRGTDVSWQSAHNLAEMLRSPDPKYDELRADAHVVRELVALVEEDLKHPLKNRQDDKSDQQRIERRMFLCWAIGSFTVDDGAPLLARLANEEKYPIEVEVRLAALEGLSTLARNVGPANLRQNQEVMQAVMEASRSVDSITPLRPAETDSVQSKPGKYSRDYLATAYRPRSEVRAVAAFTLGVLGGEEARQRLTNMLGDGYASARYNAATGLCRQGDEAAVKVLKEMLSPNNEHAAKDERNELAKDRKRVAVLVAGVQGAMTLAEANPDADLEPIITALKELGNAPLSDIKTEPNKVKILATEAYRRLEARAGK